MNKVKITGTIEHAPVELNNRSIVHVRLENKQVVTLFYDHRIIKTLLMVGDEVILTCHVVGSDFNDNNVAQIFIDKIDFVNNSLASAWSIADSPCLWQQEWCVLYIGHVSEWIWDCFLLWDYISRIDIQ